MASFDITNKTDFQKLDNGINVARKELLNRYDLKGTDSSIELDKKNNAIKIISDIDMHVDAIVDILISRSIKQGVDAMTFDLTGKIEPSGKTAIKSIPIKEGIDKESAKKIVKKIKESGLKVQAAIMDDMIRVTGKKLDDLQDVIALCRTEDFGVPLQFVNMKS
ncbi:MAG: YajQ family cyclic di-GMP-binding protein [Bacteroidota bacterium]|nr:YajQ family cyclic di-GMP-binding protein [Bacteroidota bacterium]